MAQQSQTGNISEKVQNIIVREETSYDGKPLDFSFKNIKSLDELKNLEPRSGKRKDPPKEEEDNKEEQKKVEAEEEEDQDSEQKANDQETSSQKDENEEKQESNQENGQGNQKEKDKKKEEKKPENKQPQVIRCVPNNNVHQQVINSQVPVGQQTKAGGLKAQFDDTKGTSQKLVVKINLVCSSLILSYNKIRTIANFKQNIDFVMFDGWKQNLSWIDLSHNYLETLNYNFSDVPNLKSLYLHCNYLSSLEELLKLQELPLRTLTIHGNAIETIPNFRLYIIGILPQLKRLDSVVVSKKERDNCNVWINIFKNKKIPYAIDPPKPPQETQPVVQKQ